MRKTKQYEQKSIQPLAVSITDLAGSCGCGKATARKIGEAAGAKITIGRRVLYSVPKVQAYLEKMATE